MQYRGMQQANSSWPRNFSSIETRPNPGSNIVWGTPSKIKDPDHFYPAILISKAKDSSKGFWEEKTLGD